MDTVKTAILSSCGNMTSFTVDDRVIRFRTSDHLVRYEKVTKWENGYIECLATYDNPPTTEEEYIDLVPILENLRIPPEDFFGNVQSVQIKYDPVPA